MLVIVLLFVGREARHSHKHQFYLEVQLRALPLINPHKDVASMSKGIDYSKWDHIDCSDDEDEDQMQPRVTRLDQPSRITASNGTIHVQSASSAPPPPAGSGASSSSKTTTDKTSQEPEKTHSGNGERAISSKDDDIPLSWTEKGGRTLWQDRTLCWSQDRYEVILRVNVPPTIRSKDVRVSHKGTIQLYDHRHSATMTESSSKVQIRISVANALDGKPLVLEGTLPYPIHWPQDHDPEEEDSLDWTIETTRGSEAKFLCLCLYKASPMQGVTIWWKRPLEQIEETVDPPQSSNQQGWKDAWEEAHRMFREKIRTGDIPHRLPPH